MIMQQYTRSVVLGVFEDKRQAQRALEELRRANFADENIGVVARDEHVRAEVKAGTSVHTDTYAEEGAAIGVAGGVSIGALWGLGVIANVLPAIGPVIAGGTLAAVLASAALGAAAGGLVGVLVGWGVPEEEAQAYATEVQAGRIIISVRAGDRADEAYKILQAYGARMEPQATQATY